VAETFIHESSYVDEGCTIGDVRGGAIIVGVREPDGTFHPQPPAETVLHAGQVVMALGTKRTMERLEGLFEPHRADQPS
jgi:voltage-gated potassium channel